MFNLLKRIFTLPVFEKEDDNFRAKLINSYAWISIVLMLIATPVYLMQTTLNFFTLIVTFAALAIMFTAIYLLRRGKISASGVIMITTGLLLISAGTAGADGVRGSSTVAYVALALLASIIISLQAGVIVIATSIILLWVLAVLELNGYITPDFNGGPINFTLTLSVIFIIIAVLIYFSTNSLRDTLKRVNKSEEDLRESNNELQKLTQNLEQRIEERTKELKGRTEQFEAIADVARSIASIQEMDRLLPTVTKLVSERFGFYHVGIFLLDDNKEFALLQAANSEGGSRMLARGHRLQVGQQGIVGYVALHGIARIALDVGEEAVYFNNPDLPETHSEVALPLKFGPEIIGVLDIQSTKPNAFSQEDVDLFSILADQISVAIQNARSLGQAQRALHEVEVATSQLTGQAWSGYSETIRSKGYRYDGIKPEPLKKASTTTDEQEAFTVPVQLRGQIIGRLKLKSTNVSRKWTDDELAIIESTAERVAIAMDSARLLDEAQKRATRETFLSELAAKLSTSFQMDSILRDTVEELGHVLQDSTVTFQLVNPSAPPTIVE